MNYYGYDIVREFDLYHHGIKGQRWGVRRYQNEDGSWTTAGRSRYSVGNGENGKQFSSQKAIKGLNKLSKDLAKTRYKKAVIDYKKQKAEEKGNTKKASKLEEKSKKLQSSISKGQKTANDLVKKASASGVKVGSNEHKKYMHTGKTVALSLLLSPAYGAISVGVDFHRANKAGAEAGGMVSYDTYYVKGK